MAFWGGAVLPLLGMGLGPAPGMWLFAAFMAFGVPTLAAVLLLTGAAIGLRRRRTAGRAIVSPGSLGYVLAGIMGCVAGAYAVLIASVLT
jgi:hypothetical protein